jgi:proteic killer suppression protein
MIKSFGDTGTEKIWKGTQSTKLPNQIQHVARRRLRMINNAISINDLRIPPANKLEKLKENLKGHHSIRIYEQWRITFKWKSTDAYEVKIIDYHG